VIFAHGSGSGRLSPRNHRVTAKLRAAELATLLIDLLTQAEERDRTTVFDISLLASRLSFSTDWSIGQSETAHPPIGYFGASTGAGAALVAAAAPRSPVKAVVSRAGGRISPARRSPGCWAHFIDRREPRHARHRARPRGL
jgi:putative phosphoribosyl transferase